ncbi:priA protein [Pseudohyphozyma bogoriensis]|nr:priA protein [Pseudohyphozyma bogoriensis]
MPSLARVSVAVLALVSLAAGFQLEGGPACSPRAGCPAYTYTFVNGNGITQTVTVTGTQCAPKYALNAFGATCTTDDECYNGCGDDGICGGVGSGCNSQDPFTHNQGDIACYNPGFICSTATFVNGVAADPAADSLTVTGICLLAPSAAARARARRAAEAQQQGRSRRSQIAFDGIGQQFCPGTALTQCGLGICVDTQSGLNTCGGCDADSGAVDCSAIPNVDEVRCDHGKCVIDSCEQGYRFFNNRCLSIKGARGTSTV